MVDARGGSKRRILIVTDHALIAESMQVLLSMCDHDVETASDGAGALERGRPFRTTMALIDVDLGKGQPSGYEVARHLRAALGASVFLIVHTGYDLNDVRREARAAGFDAYLPKGFDREELDRLPSVSRRMGTLWEDTPGPR